MPGRTDLLNKFTINNINFVAVAVLRWPFLCAAAASPFIPFRRFVSICITGSLVLRSRLMPAMARVRTKKSKNDSKHAQKSY